MLQALYVYLSLTQFANYKESLNTQISSRVPFSALLNLVNSNSERGPHFFGWHLRTVTVSH